MTITQEVVDSIPKKWYLCNADVQKGYGDGQWCYADGIFYCAEPFTFFHYESEEIRECAPGFYCFDCLMESHDYKGVSIEEYLRNPEQYPSVPKLPQFMYPCKKCSADIDPLDSYEVEPIYWYGDSILETGFYCIECISDALWGLPDDDRYDILDTLGENPYYDVYEVAKHKDC